MREVALVTGAVGAIVADGSVHVLVGGDEDFATHADAASHDGRDLSGGPEARDAV